MIGDNRQRLLKYINYKKNGYRFPNAIHNKAYLSEFAQIGEGSFVMGTAIINPGSNIGNCCIINTNATVGYDCIIEDAVQLGPGVNIAGSCHIKQGVFIGIGAKVAPRVTIGAWTVVGPVRLCCRIYLKTLSAVEFMLRLLKVFINKYLMVLKGGSSGAA